MQDEHGNGTLLDYDFLYNKSWQPCVKFPFVAGIYSCGAAFQLAGLMYKLVKAPVISSKHSSLPLEHFSHRVDKPVTRTSIMHGLSCCSLQLLQGPHLGRQKLRGVEGLTCPQQIGGAAC